LKEFNNIQITVLRKDMETALKEVANKHDIIINLGRITYSSFECRGSFTSVCQKDEKENIISPMEKAYIDRQKSSSGMLNLGDTFESRRSTYTIAGWKPKNTKYPLIANNEVGQSYKFAGRFAIKDGY